MQFSSYASIPYALAIVCIVGLSLSRRKEAFVRAFHKASFPPIYLLLGLVGLAIVLYPPLTNDSLYYRIPRIFLWLQEGTILHLPVVDQRINYMAHNWELLALPLLQVSGLTFLELPSVAAYVICYGVFHYLLTCHQVHENKARYLATLAVSGTFFVLQAASTMNDLLAVSFLLASLVMILHFENARVPSSILYSGISLALAAGTKPHFSVLALAWICWFVFSPAKAWRTRVWQHLPWAAPLALLLSSLPGFVINTISYGSFIGPVAQSKIHSGGSIFNLIAGWIMLVWQSLQPPINPLASIFGRQQFQNLFPLLENSVAKFSLATSPIAMVENASMGTVLTLACLVGIAFGALHRRDLPLQLLLAAVAGICGFSLAISQVVPSTLGRSFFGFLVLTIPFCLLGLARLPLRIIQVCAGLSVVSAVVALAASPSHPLWPARTLQAKVASHGSSLQAGLKRYISFQERYTVARELVEMIPSRSKIAVLTGAGEPLVQLWLAGTRDHTFQFIPVGTTLHQLEQSHVEYVLVGGLASEEHANLPMELRSSEQFVLLEEQAYLQVLQKGTVTWSLFRKAHRDAPLPQKFSTTRYERSSLPISNPTLLTP